MYFESAQNNERYKVNISKETLCCRCFILTLIQELDFKSKNKTTCIYCTFLVIIGIVYLTHHSATAASANPLNTLKNVTKNFNWDQGFNIQAVTVLWHCNSTVVQCYWAVLLSIVTALYHFWHYVPPWVFAEIAKFV